MVIKMKLGLCDFIVFILVLVSVHAVEKAMQTECVGPQCGQVNAAEYSKLLVKLHQIQNKLEELENSCKINQEIQCQIDPLQKAKLQAKVIKTQAALNLLEVSGVDAMTLKNQFVANLEVKKLESEKARMETYWISKQNVSSKPVFNKFGKTLLEVTENKIIEIKSKIATLEEKLIWLKSNPEIPLQFASATQENGSNIASTTQDNGSNIASNNDEEASVLEKDEL